MREPNDDDKQRWDRFAYLVRRVAAGTVTGDEFEEFGVVIRQRTLAWVAIIQCEADAREFVCAVYEKVMANLARLAEVENPWGMFQALVRNKIIDELRRERTWKKHLARLEEQSDGECDLIEESLAGADPSPDPALLALLGDDWRQLEELLRSYPNRQRVALAFFWDWVMGFRIVDIAEQYGVSQNKVQLAVGRVQVFVLRALLQEEWQRVERILCGFKCAEHLALFGDWVGGKEVQKIAAAAKLSRKEVQSAIRAVLTFIIRRWNS